MGFSKNSAVTKGKFSFYLPSLTTAQGPGGGEVSLATFLGDEKLSLPPSLLPSSSDVLLYENETSPKIAERKREHNTRVKIKTTIKMTLRRSKIK